MFVHPVAGGPTEAVGYLVYDHPGGHALIVDAPLGSTSRYVEALAANNLELLNIVNTHGHWDHIADNAALCNATGAPLCAHSWDATRLANPALTAENDGGSPLPIQPSKADRALQDGDILEVGSFKFEIIHTPGHTPGSVCFYESALAVVFTGDTLGRHWAGRTNAPGGNLLQLTSSFARLAALPDATRVYPGRGPSATIGEERWLLEL